MKDDFVFSSESVTEGHPDKLCDQISDAIVDRFLQHDATSRVSAECAVTHALIFIAARFASSATVDLPGVARQVLDLTGYRGDCLGSRSCSIITSLHELPVGEKVLPEHDLSDVEIDAIPARHEGTAFGFACKQTPAYMPLPIWLAHRLARRLSSLRMEKLLPYLGPEGRVRVAVEYKNRVPIRLHSITMVASHYPSEAPEFARFKDDLVQTVIEPSFDDEPIKPDERTRIFINPDGPLVSGGPSAHAGLTGRKSSVDLYGEYARQSATAMSGKDPCRIDRIGAYAARYAAKNVVAADLAEECEILLSYSIGEPRPVCIQAETFGTGRISDAEITALVARHFEFRLAGIVQQFNLTRLPSTVKGGFYRKLAAYGQVGRTDMGLPWEVTDRAPLLRALAGMTPVYR